MAIYIKKVLTLDKVNGVSIRDHIALKEKNIDLKKIAENLIQHFLRQAVRDGFFHADMHEGNLFVDDERKYCSSRFWYNGQT